MSHKQRERSSLRRSLRDTLKSLLPTRGRNVKSTRSIGSGVLRKADISHISTAFLPAISAVSLFPDFTASKFNVDTYRRVERTSNLGSYASVSRQSLLPKTSLSQFNLHATFVSQVQQPYDIVFTSIPDQLRHGHSRQASLVSASSHEARRQKSTLRLQASRETLADDQGSQASLSSEQRYVTSNPQSPLVSQRRPGARRVFDTPPSVKVVGLSHGLVRHFSSFCVLDTATPGCPVTATSKDLRFVFDVGEQFFLNNQECPDASMDVVTGCDAEGNPVSHLVLFNPLTSPSSGRSRFMLASLVDITDFIQDHTSRLGLVSTSELETIIEDSLEDEDIKTPSTTTRHERWPGIRYELSATDLLGGCCLDDETQHPPVHMHGPDSDIWVDLASEERVKYRAREERLKPNFVLSSQRTDRANGRSRNVPPSTYGTPPASTSWGDDDLLDNFIAELQELYADFFLLATTPFDDFVYEICNVSPTVYADRDYLHGNLSHTPGARLARMSENLSRDVAFHLNVRWGEQGTCKQLYCVPLFTESSTTWICFLVDMEVGYLW